MTAADGCNGRLDNEASATGHADRRALWLADLAPGAAQAILGAWVLGLVAAPVLGWVAGWGAVAACPALAGALAWRMKGRPGAAAAWALVAATLLAASVGHSAARGLDAPRLARFATDPSQPAVVEGRILEPPQPAPSTGGVFEAFNFRPPSTRLLLQVHRLHVDGDLVPMEGRLRVYLQEATHTLRAGQRVRLSGWLGSIAPPLNPGEFDQRGRLAEMGIVGRLTVTSRAAVTALPDDRSRAVRFWARTRESISQAAVDALGVGMDDAPEPRMLLERMLLGRDHPGLQDLNDAFRAVGLAHLLAISGAHLAMLLGIVWLIARLCTGQPSRAALTVLLVLGLFLLAVPLRTPIVRAGLMAGLFALVKMTGRHARAIDVLCLAALLILIVRPLDLTSAGFQLSFGIVAALMLFARPLSEWLLPPPDELDQAMGSTAERWRLPVDFFAANVVAFVIGMPLVAHHFEIITPWAIVLSMLALPVIVLTLGLGYLKIMLGLIAPSAGLVLAGPVTWLTESLVLLVEQSGSWPGATVTLAQSPGGLWCAAAVVVAIAWLGGAFASRRLPLAASVAILTGWLWISVQPPPHRIEPSNSASTANLRGWRRPASDPVALALNMFAVGDGSSFLVRAPAPQSPGGWASLMFDCGSQHDFGVGARRVVPALRALGVRSIDVLVVSHADLDHFSGVPDVLDAVNVGEIWAPPQLLDAAGERTGSAVALLMSEIRRRGVPVVARSRGWTGALGDARLELLWPPADRRFRWDNDSSLVLRIEQAGRRVTLYGDAQQEALTSLLALSDDLAGDVADLPHHGSFVKASPAWLARTAPGIILQSSGARRLEFDPWPVHLDALDPPPSRYVTARSGMVTLLIRRSGDMSAEEFIPAATSGR